MRKFLLGFSVGLGTSIIVYKIVSKNQEQILEIIRSLPKPIKIEPGSTLKEVKEQEDNFVG